MRESVKEAKKEKEKDRIQRERDQRDWRNRGDRKGSCPDREPLGHYGQSSNYDATYSNRYSYQTKFCFYCKRTSLLPVFVQKSISM